jgi:glycerophosphoryl diester phosphodiesterase
MFPETYDFRERPVTLIHHAAHCKDKAPPGSLSALEACLKSGSSAIEIDVIPLADGQFALLHDQNLDTETNGSGKAHLKTRAEIEKLYYVVRGEVTEEKVGFLEDAVDLLGEHPDIHRLQLDLKPFAPLTQAILRNFIGLIKPVIDRIQVTSVADWAVRSLARFAPELSLGFDPLLYLDMVNDIPRPKEIPPFRVGAYNLLDDHPLSAYQWGPMGEYFAARAAALLVQAPTGCEWFIRAKLLKLALTAGFDWIDFLHHHGSKVDAWTIDVDDPEQVSLAQELVKRGIDDLTTDTPKRLAAYLPSKSIC